MREKKKPKGYGKKKIEDVIVQPQQIQQNDQAKQAIKEENKTDKY